MHECIEYLLNLLNGRINITYKRDTFYILFIYVFTLYLRT